MNEIYLSNAKGGGHLIFDGKIISFPQFGSKRRKLQLHISNIDGVMIQKGRGLVGEILIVVGGKEHRFLFNRRNNRKAEKLVEELLKASANPESYTLPQKWGSSNENQPLPRISQQEPTQRVEKNDGGSGGNLNRLESLKMLGELKESGVLTEEEFAAEKAKVLEGEVLEDSQRQTQSSSIQKEGFTVSVRFNNISMRQMIALPRALNPVLDQIARKYNIHIEKFSNPETYKEVGVLRNFVIVEGISIEDAELIEKVFKDTEKKSLIGEGPKVEISPS